MEKNHAMSDIWYEDELCVSDRTVKDLEKGPGEPATRLLDDAQHWARGIVRIDHPRWIRFGPGDQFLGKGKKASFVLVRLGFQFDIPPHEGRLIHFVYARCMARIWPADREGPAPTVYDLVPRELYEGEPRQMQVEIGPEIKLKDVSVSLGKISTSINVGTLEPVIVGYPGKDEQAPYWDLRPKTKRLIGTRHLWLILEIPDGCSGTRLAVRAEGDVQTKLGPIPLGPKSREWAQRPSVLIE